MSFNVDKEIEWLTTSILPEILKNGRLVDNYSDSLLITFKVKDIQINVIGAEEAFMLTQCYRATVNFEFAGEQQLRKLVVKKTPELPPEYYNDIQFDDLFHNEILFYTEILPKVQKYGSGIFAIPKYYHSEIKPYFALLILGDFVEGGWALTKDRYGLSLEHARIAVKYLGNFHAFGYALKHNQQEFFQKLTNNLRESRYSKDTLVPEWEQNLKCSLLRVEKATNTHQPQVDKDFVRKFQTLVGNYTGYGRQRVAPREPLSTLCHGDFLRNNVAYKYDTDNSTPLDIMMFDYQTMRFSSPMIDLSVFLALSVLTEVRYKHFDSLFDDYCTAVFEGYAKYSTQPLPEYINRENMLKEYIRFLPYSVSVSAFFLMMLVEPQQMTSAEMFAIKRTEEEIFEQCMTQGGEIVDREIAHQMMEMFELSRKHNVPIDEDIDITAWSKN